MERRPFKPHIPGASSLIHGPARYMCAECDWDTDSERDCYWHARRTGHNEYREGTKATYLPFDDPYHLEAGDDDEAYWKAL